MACMEHECLDCQWWDMDNTGGPTLCPKCGSMNMRHRFDEWPEADWPEDEEDDES